MTEVIDTGTHHTGIDGIEAETENAVEAAARGDGLEIMSETAAIETMTKAASGLGHDAIQKTGAMEQMHIASPRVQIIVDQRSHDPRGTGKGRFKTAAHYTPWTAGARYKGHARGHSPRPTQTRLKL